MRIRRILLALIALVAGCGGASRYELPLPAARPLDLPAGAIRGCGGIAMATVVRGNRADPRLAWLIGMEDGKRTDVVWPDGYVARFGPSLEVLDEVGQVVLREGDFVAGACYVGDPHMLVDTPLPGFRLECGPRPLAECTNGVLLKIAQRNGWPSRDIAVIKFLTFDGRYVLTYEDGTQATGDSPPD